VELSRNDSCILPLASCALFLEDPEIWLVMQEYHFDVEVMLLSCAIILVKDQTCGMVYAKPVKRSDESPHWKHRTPVI